MMRLKSPLLCVSLPVCVCLCVRGVFICEKYTHAHRAYTPPKSKIGTSNEERAAKKCLATCKIKVILTTEFSGSEYDCVIAVDEST